MTNSTSILVARRSGFERIAEGSAAIARRIFRLMNFHGTSPSKPVTVSNRREQKRRLKQAMQAIQSRRFDEAETSLSEAREHAPHDCAAWNLLGIVHECRAEWKQARRCYGIAVAGDKSFAPAQQNLRRLYELFTFGKSDEPIAFGMTPRHWRNPEASLIKEPALSTPS